MNSYLFRDQQKPVLLYSDDVAVLGKNGSLEPLDDPLKLAKVLFFQGLHFREYNVAFPDMLQNPLRVTELRNALNDYTHLSSSQSRFDSFRNTADVDLYIFFS